jgi:hypothetical protein
MSNALDCGSLGAADLRILRGRDFRKCLPLGFGREILFLLTH